MVSSRKMSDPVWIIPAGSTTGTSGAWGNSVTNIRLATILTLLFLFQVLMLVTPVQAITTSLTPATAYAGSTSDAYASKLDPSADATDFFFLNITIPAGYDFILPPTGQLVGIYTMYNKSTGNDQVIIKIISNDTVARTVDVNYSSNYGANYDLKVDQNLSNIIIGSTILKITEPASTSAGYINFSLGGAAGPVNSTYNNVTITLTAGTLRNPSTQGNYKWILDARNNPAGPAYYSYNIVKIDPAPSQPPSNNDGGSGGGGGGGGVSTAEPFENILISERQEKDLLAQKFVTYNFTTPEITVSEIYVNGKENEMGVTIRIEVLKGTSELVKIPPPGIVYKNVNMWASSKRIAYSFIRFKVENSWLVSNNLETGDIKMVKWMGREKWVQLETRKIDQNNTFTYYEVKSDDFGIFAITGMKQEPTPEGTPIEITIPTTVTKSPVKEIKDIIQAPIEKAGGFEVVLALAILAAVYLFSQKRK